MNKNNGVYALSLQWRRMINGQWMLVDMRDSSLRAGLRKDLFEVAQMTRSSKCLHGAKRHSLTTMRYY